MNKADEDDNLSRLIESYIRQLFDDREVSPAMQMKLFAYYYQELSKGVDVGYSPTFEMHDEALAVSFKKNIAEFSAFKATSFKKQLESFLIQDGKITPWSDFKKQADALHIEYNRRWLKTEYHQTVAVANMAQQWQQFEADADLYPNLKIVSAGDGRVRDKHKILDGLILPINHSFWKTHTTPFEWGCRCHIVQTDEKASDTIPDFKFKKEHENNPAMSGKVFPKNAYEMGLDKDGIKEAKNLLNNSQDNNEALSRYRDIEFKKQKGIKNGGVFEVYVNGKQNKIEEAKNMATLKLLSNFGYKYRILPVINDGGKNPDAYNLITKVFSDIKNASSTNGLNIVQNSLKEASNQKASELIIRLEKELENPSSIYKGIYSTISQGRASGIDKIVLINAKNEVREFDLVKFRKLIKNKKG